VPPQYIFNGNPPQSGQTYRAGLATDVTSDFQFARAAVNYLWAEFFGMGIVDPPDTFDLARLDPNNPPPASVDSAAHQCGRSWTPWLPTSSRRVQRQGHHA